VKNKILIFGAGTIGVFIGTKLKDAGFDITLKGRKRLDQLNDIIHINDSVQTELPHRADRLDNTKFDVIFVTVKLYDLLPALEEISSRHISYDTLVLTQNGIQTDKILDGSDRKKIVKIAIFEGYTIASKDKILAQDNLRGWQLNESSGSESILEILGKAGIKAEISKNFDTIKAEKMLINCSVSALSIIKDKTIGNLMNDSEDRSVVIKLIDETYSVLCAKYNMRPLDQVRQITIASLEANASHYPSLYQDFKRGEKTELDYFNGQIIQWAKELNIPVHVSEEIYNKAKQILGSNTRS